MAWGMDTVFNPDWWTTASSGSTPLNSLVSTLLPVGVQSVAGMYNGQNNNRLAQQKLEQDMEIERMREASAERLQQQQLAESMKAAELAAAVQQQAILQRAYEAALTGQNASEGINQNALNSFIQNVQNAYRIK